LIKLETWIIPSACLHHKLIPLPEDTEEVILPLEFKNSQEKKVPQQKSMQLVVVVNFKGIAVDPCSIEESSSQMKGNAASKRNSACTAANQDTSPPIAI